MDAQSPMALILVGQSELGERLALQAYAAIRQRIDLHCKLPHNDRPQTEAYIQRNLDYAGGAERDIFSAGGTDDIYRFSNGTARLINKACTHFCSTVRRTIIASSTIIWSDGSFRENCRHSPFPFSFGYSLPQRPDNLHRQLPDTMRQQQQLTFSP
jgi:hypothetical protein